jgi:hypothetical protein
VDQQDFKERKRQQISLQISDGPLGYGAITIFSLKEFKLPIRQNIFLMMKRRIRE